MKFNLYFGPVREEVQKKNLSMIHVSSDSEDSFVRLCEKNLSKDSMEEIFSAMIFSKSIDIIDKNHASNDAYFVHALRVAKHTLCSLVEPDVELVKTALIHNVFEISGISRNELIESGFSDFTADAIDIQTVDRARQFNDDYLEVYYKNIKDFGPRLMLLRCLDKLDNLQAFQLIPEGDLRTNWLKNTKDYIFPMAKEIDKVFGDYFLETLEYMDSVGCDENLRIQYEKNK